jgi:hypothetical protein
MKSAHRSLTGTGAGTSPATTPKTTIAGRSLPIVDVRMCIRAGGAVFNGVVPYLEVRTGNQLGWIAVQFNSASGKTGNCCFEIGAEHFKIETTKGRARVIRKASRDPRGISVALDRVSDR